MGIPKRNSNESRPIAVASVFVRLWHRVFLGHLPQSPDQQWSEEGVVAATASWLANDNHPLSGAPQTLPDRAGAEIDMAKAYDSVKLSAAEQALRFSGTPEAVTALLKASWHAPRRCHVEVERAVSWLETRAVSGASQRFPRLGTPASRWKYQR